MRFYLGTHNPAWLSRLPVDLFVSHRRLGTMKRLPRAICDWALDSGGFSELSLFGEWRTTPEDYAKSVTRYAAEIGRLQWAAIQDHMCEPHLLAKTGLAVADHQRKTIESCQRLHDLAPDIPWAPVLQGWERDDYLRHLDAYQAAGWDLDTAPVVGVGSVCRRQNVKAVRDLLQDLAADGLRVHAFGFKIQGLSWAGPLLASSDSMAWSFTARRRAPLPGHTHKNCANCPEFALQWRDKVLACIP